MPANGRGGQRRRNNNRNRGQRRNNRPQNLDEVKQAVANDRDVQRNAQNDPNAPFIATATRWFTMLGAGAFSASSEIAARVSEFVMSYDEADRERAYEAIGIAVGTSGVIPRRFALWLPTAMRAIGGVAERIFLSQDPEAREHLTELVDLAWQDQNTAPEVNTANQACMGDRRNSVIHRVGGCRHSRVENVYVDSIRGLIEGVGDGHALCTDPACFGRETREGVVRIEAESNQSPPERLSPGQQLAFGLVGELVRDNETLGVMPNFRLRQALQRLGLLNNPAALTLLPEFTRTEAQEAYDHIRQLRRLREEEQRLLRNRRSESNDETRIGRERMQEQLDRIPVLSPAQLRQRTFLTERLQTIVQRLNPYFEMSESLGTPHLPMWQFVGLTVFDRLDAAVDNETRDFVWDRVDHGMDIAQGVMNLRLPGLAQRGLNALQNFGWLGLMLWALGIPMLVSGMVGYFFPAGGLILWVAYIICATIWSLIGLRDNAEGWGGVIARGYRTQTALTLVIAGGAIPILGVNIFLAPYFAYEAIYGDGFIGYEAYMRNFHVLFMSIGMCLTLLGGLLLRVWDRIIFAVVDTAREVQRGIGVLGIAGVAAFNAIPWVDDIPLPQLPARRPADPDADTNRPTPIADTTQIVNMVAGAMTMCILIFHAFGVTHPFVGLFYGAFWALLISMAEFLRKSRARVEEQWKKDMTLRTLRIMFVVLVLISIGVVSGVVINGTRVGQVVYTSYDNAVSDLESEYGIANADTSSEAETAGSRIARKCAGLDQSDPAQKARFNRLCK